MPEFNPQHEQILHDHLGNNPNAGVGKMFGYPGYKVRGKLAVGVHAQGVIVKIGRDRASKLIEETDGIEKFEPLEGRVWRDWVLLTKDIESHTGLFDEAVDYVLKETAS